MRTVRLLTLGALRLTCDGNDVLVGRRKELVLLAYVARHAPHPVPREDLATLLWGERSEARARHSLRQTLLRLKQALGDVVEISPSDVRLGPDAVAMDVRLFESALADERHADAVSLWCGDFLPGLEDVGGDRYRFWLEQEREGLRRRLSGAFERVCEDAETRGAAAEAVDFAECWVAALPYDEAAHARLVAALRRCERIADARARHGAALARMRDIGVRPSSALLGLGSELDAAFRQRARRAPGSGALLAPDLIGRAGPLHTLQTLWARVRDESVVVLLEGEEGIGKTRLAREFLRGLRAGGHAALVLEGRAEESDADAPWSTVRRLLQPLVRSPAVEDAPNRAVGELSEVLPALRTRFPHIPVAAGLPGGTADALGEVLRMVGARTPVLIFADDFFHADRASRELLLTLARTPPPAGMLLLIAVNPDEQTSSLFSTDLNGSTHVRRLKLQPLSGEQIGALVASMLELVPEDRPLVAARVHLESGGNPYYASELVAGLADAALLVLGGDGCWRIAQDFESRTLPLPRDARQAIAKRLEHVPRNGRLVLEAGAVLGGRFDLGTLEAVTALPGGAFSEALEVLLVRRLLREAPADPPAYELSHDILRRVIYERIPAVRRAELHAAALRALPAHSTDGDSARSAREHHRALAGRPRWRGRVTAIRVAAAAALVLALATAVALRSNATAGVAESEARVLVAPFVNRTGDRTLDALGTIAADWVAQGLARTGLVRVVPAVASPPPETARPGGERQRDALAAARALADAADANVLVFGELLRAGDSLRWHLRIVHARDAELIAAVAPVSAPATNPMSALEPLRQRTIARLAPLFDPRMAAWSRVSSVPPSYEAYLAFAEGIEAYNAREPGRDPSRHFLHAYALDTTFTLPLLYAALERTEASALAAAGSLIERVAPRGPELAPFDRALLDYVSAAQRGDHAGELTAARAAAEIAPQSLIAAVELPLAATTVNRPREALMALDRIDADHGAVRSNASHWHFRAQVLHMLDDYDGQLEVARELRRRFPRESGGLSHQARALAALGRLDELDRVLEQALLLPPVPLWGAPGLRMHVFVSDELRAHGHSGHAGRVLERAVSFYQAAPPELRAVAAQRYQMGRALYRLGRLDEARLIFQAVLDDPGEFLADVRLDSRVHLGHIAALTANDSVVQQVDAWLRDMRDPYLFGWNTESRAAMHAIRGDRETAMRLLRQATSEGRPFDGGKHATFEYGRMRDYPPFREWLRPKG